jgi:predicted transcriptional regulator YheO
MPQRKKSTARASRSVPPGSRETLVQATRGYADGIAALFFPYAEVVVHDLATQTIAYIANNLSQREIGDASALDNAEFDPKELVVGPYEKRNWDGGTMRCVSVVVRDQDQHPVGLTCVNLNISVFKQVSAALELLVTGTRITSQPAVLFRDDWQERINTFIHGWLENHQLSLAALTRQQRTLLVEDLYAHGGFAGRSAAAYVARVLGMGPATVFKRLKELRSR